MSFTLVRSPVTNWVNGSTVLPSEFAAFDAKIAAAINGVNGGCWAPTAPLVFAGQGLQVTGPVIVWGANGVLATMSGSGGRFTIANGSWPILGPGHAGATRTLRSDLRLAWSTGPVRYPTAGMQSLVAMVANANGTSSPAEILAALRCHDNAVLSSVVISMLVGSAHSQLPSTMPKARVLKCDVFGNVTPMTSTVAGADVNGYVTMPTPSSANAWGPSAGVQTLTIPIDTANTINLANAYYILDILEETPASSTGGATSSAVLANVRAAATGNVNIATIGLGTIDGVALNANDRVLLPAQTSPGQNGVWIAQSGAWTRSSDLVAPSQFLQGLLIPVNEGVTNGGTVWSLTSSNVTAGLATARLASAGANVTTSGAATVDGVAVANNDLVLCKDQTTAVQNGLYQVNTGGAWTLVWSFAQGINGSGSALVNVTIGTVNGGATWLVNNGSASVSNATITLSQLAALGNVWLSAALNFAKIADLRPF